MFELEIREAEKGSGVKVNSVGEDLNGLSGPNNPLTSSKINGATLESRA